MTTTIKITDADIVRLNHRFDTQMRSGAIIKLAREDQDCPAAGWYQSNTGDVTLDGSIEFDQMLTVEGLVTHEASHSTWSNWLDMDLLRRIQSNPERLSLAELGVIKTLEEARIEAHAVNSHHGSRQRLRSCYSHLLADGFADPANYTSVAGSITCWALAWGRVHSGVIDPDELDKIDKLVRDRFGNFPMDCFDDLLGEFTTMTFGGFSYGSATPLPDRAIEIAREWLDLIKSLQESEGEMDTEDILVNIIEGILGEENEDVTTGKGEPTDEDGEGEGNGEGEGDESDEDGERTVTAGGEATDEESDEDGEGSGGEGESDDGEPITERAHGDGGSGERYGWAEAFEEAARTVSGSPHKEVEVRRMSVRDKLAKIWKKRRTSGNWREDAPTAKHRQMIVRMAKALERDATPAMVRTRVTSQVPPGRLIGRGAMTAAADRAAGRMTQAEPWRATRRHHIERPPVIIGVATDTSGSMAEYTDMLGEVSYITAHASKRVNAKFAAVTFGYVAEPVVAVGETPSMIRVRSANSGHEAFDDAMAALDGPLRLTDGSVYGRKLLIVVSDAELVRYGEKDKALLWLKALAAGDCDVIWVGVSTGSEAEKAEHGYSYETELIGMARDAGLKNIKWVPALHSADEFVQAILNNLKGA